MIPVPVDPIPATALQFAKVDTKPKGIQFLGDDEHLGLVSVPMRGGALPRIVEQAVSGVKRHFNSIPVHCAPLVPGANLGQVLKCNRKRYVLPFERRPDSFGLPCLWFYPHLSFEEAGQIPDASCGVVNPSSVKGDPLPLGVGQPPV